MATYTLAQRSALLELRRRKDGKFGTRENAEMDVRVGASVPNKYAMLQLKRLGYGQKVIDECSEQLALELNVNRQFDDEAVAQIAADIFDHNFVTSSKDYLAISNALGDNSKARDALDTMLQRDTPSEKPLDLNDPIAEMYRQKAVSTDDPRVQQADPSIKCVQHEGMIYHKLSAGSRHPEGLVQGVRIQSAMPISDKQMHEMAQLIGYENKAVMHSTGTMSVPVRDSPHSFVMRNVPLYEEDGNGSAKLKQEVKPRAHEKIQNFLRVLPSTMEVGSSYVRKDGTRKHGGIEGGLPEGFSIFMAIKEVPRES